MFARAIPLHIIHEAVANYRTLSVCLTFIDGRKKGGSCRPCLRKQRNRSLRLLSAVGRTELLGANHRSLPPLLASKLPISPWFLPSLRAVPQFSTALFVLKWPHWGGKMMTFGGESEHLNGRKWPLARPKLSRNIEMLRAFILMAHSLAVQNREFRGWQIAKWGVKQAFWRWKVQRSQSLLHVPISDGSARPNLWVQKKIWNDEDFWGLERGKQERFTVEI